MLFYNELGLNTEHTEVGSIYGLWMKKTQFGVPTLKYVILNLRGPLFLKLESGYSNICSWEDVTRINAIILLKHLENYKFQQSVLQALIPYTPYLSQLYGSLSIHKVPFLFNLIYI